MSMMRSNTMSVKSIERDAGKVLSKLNTAQLFGCVPGDHVEWSYGFQVSLARIKHVVIENSPVRHLCYQSYHITTFIKHSPIIGGTYHR